MVSDGKGFAMGKEMQFPTEEQWVVRWETLLVG